MKISQKEIDRMTLSYTVAHGISSILPYFNYVNLTELWISSPEELIPSDAELQDDTLVYVLDQQAGVTFRTWALYNMMKYKNVTFMCADASLVDHSLSLKNAWKELQFNDIPIDL